MGAVYLYHFSQKVHHAQHYIGFVEDEERVEERLFTHLRGAGAKLLRACNQRGIYYDIVRVWFGVDRDFERKLKRRKKSRCLCPECVYQRSGRKLKPVMFN